LRASERGLSSGTNQGFAAGCRDPAQGQAFTKFRAFYEGPKKGRAGTWLTKGKKKKTAKKSTHSFEKLHAPVGWV